jgi:thioredoxin reductase
VMVAAVVGSAALGGAVRWIRRRERAAASAPPVGVDPMPRRRLPVIDTTTCIGCSACVDVCPYDVLELHAYVARVVRPDDCCGLTLCEQKCPNGSLVVTDGDPIFDRPAIDGRLESLDVPGLFVAGDLTGMPLIRNAIHQGALAAQAASASLRATPAGTADVDVVVVGSGPAGLSAALQLQSDGVRHIVLEQGSVAESIRSFPRGKLVFDQPLGVPLVGDLWLAEATKEELLGKWLRIVRRHRVPIEEGCRVTSIARPADGTEGFVVRAVGAGRERVWTARRVIVAIGKRGTPRKLDAPVPEAWLDRVHYALADARSFAGRRLLVVGLGDVAMESAIALARQAETHVELAARGTTFRRGKSRNVAEVERLVAAGRLTIHWSTEVGAFGPSGDTVALIRRDTGEIREHRFDAVFVMIGSIVPWSFLEGAGIRRMDAAPARVSPARDGEPPPMAPGEPWSA